MTENTKHGPHDPINAKPYNHDPVNHPTHYASEAKCTGCNEPIECIDVVRTHDFTRGNAIKYLWRAGSKGDTIQDLKKAIWYIEDEIATLEGRKNPNVHRLQTTNMTNAQKANQRYNDAVSLKENYIGTLPASEESS